MIKLIFSLTFNTQIPGHHSQSAPAWCHTRSCSISLLSMSVYLVYISLHSEFITYSNLQFSSHHDIWTVITGVNLACFVVSGNRLHRWPEALIGIECNIWKCVSSYSVFGGALNNGKITLCYPLWRHLCYKSCYLRVKLDKKQNFLDCHVDFEEKIIDANYCSKGRHLLCTDYSKLNARGLDWTCLRTQETE